MFEALHRPSNRPYIQHHSQHRDPDPLTNDPTSEVLLEGNQSLAQELQNADICGPKGLQFPLQGRIGSQPKMTQHFCKHLPSRRLQAWPPLLLYNFHKLSHVSSMNHGFDEPAI